MSWHRFLMLFFAQPLIFGYDEPFSVSTRGRCSCELVASSNSYYRSGIFFSSRNRCPFKFPNGNIYCKWALRKRKIPERECCVKGCPMKYTPQQIGALIRSTRKSLGVTQRDLALTSGTGLRFVVDLERGKETCEIGKALTILQTLGIRLTLTPPAAAEAKEK